MLKRRDVSQSLVIVIMLLFGAWTMSASAWKYKTEKYKTEPVQLINVRSQVQKTPDCELNQSGAQPPAQLRYCSP